MTARKTTSQFIKESKLIHGDKYEYSKVIYKTNKDRVILTCEKHGDFKIIPHWHLSGKGCTYCSFDSSQKSNIERKNKVLEKLNYNLKPDENTRLIELRHGGFVLINEESFDLVKDRVWRLSKTGYAFTKIKNKTIYMHKLIFNSVFTNYKGQVDHIDMDKLNCKTSNLRKATHSQNQMNRLGKPNSTSKYKGVSYYKRDDMWDMRITFSGTTIRKRFNTEIEAALCYNEHAIEFHGKFARLNEIAS